MKPLVSSIFFVSDLSVMDGVHLSSLAFKEQSAVGKSSLFPLTRREVRAADPSLSSGMHWIDPDGVGDDPIYVFCDMTKGKIAAR